MSKLDPERGSTQCPQIAPPVKKQTLHLGLQMLCSDPQHGSLVCWGRREDCSDSVCEQAEVRQGGFQWRKLTRIEMA